MPHKFNVVPDSSGRINHFVEPDFPNDPISPENIGERIDGGERVTVSGVEYDLTENGSLVHPDVEVIGSVALGFGTRIGKGTVFHGLDSIVIGDRTRIDGTEVHDQVQIGQYAFILARSIGSGVKIGDYCRFREGVDIQNDVVVGRAVKMAREVGVFSGVTIEDNARLGHATRVGEGATIGRNAKIGVRGGPDRTGFNQGGIYVAAGEIVPAKSFR